MDQSHIRVLLIEDNPGDARLIQAMLSHAMGWTFSVQHLDRLGAGLAYLAARQTDVVLLDLGLPDSVGLETFHRLREHSPQVPVVVLTGLDDELFTLGAMRAGAEDYLLKQEVSESLLVRTLLYAIERKQVAEALRRERDFAQSLVASTQAIVLVLDTAGRVVLLNPYLEKLAGYSLDEARGRNWFTTFVAEPDRPGFLARFRQTLKGVAVPSFTGLLQTRSGSQRVIEWRPGLLKVAPEVVLGARFTGHDITELQHSQEQALQAERLAAIGQMVAGLAHESGNALQEAQSCVEMLTLEVQGSPKALDLVAGIQEAQDRLRYLFEEIRNYAAPFKLERRVCNLADVWQQAWTHLARQRQGRQAALLTESNDLDLRCLVDPFRMEQVFRNILDNALAACQDPVQITIRCTATHLDSRPALQIAVGDNGPGLTVEQRQRIFEPFYTTKAENMGLGMAITKRLVEAHGGQIAVSSDHGVGAEILLILPRGGSS